MQLTCPACSARYLVSSAALGEEGKDVRCAKCGHQWFQVALDSHSPVDQSVDNTVDDLNDMYEDDLENEFKAPPEENSVENLEENPVDEFVERFEDNNDEAAINDEGVAQDIVDDRAEDIPDGVKPIKETQNVPALAKDVIRPTLGRFAKISGIVASILLFGGLVLLGVIFKKQIVTAWVPAAAIYGVLGMPIELQGKGLVIENVSAKLQRDVDGKNFLLLEGRVINLTNEAQPLPKLYARLRSTNGIDGEGWEIEPSLKRLPPGESLSFQSDYPAVPDGIGSVNLSFLPTVK